MICLERDAAVSANREEAEDAWLSRNLALWQYYAGHGASGLDGPVDDFAPGRAVAGTPDDCIAQLIECRDRIGCEYLQLMNLGTGPASGTQRVTNPNATPSSCSGGK